MLVAGVVYSPSEDSLRDVGAEETDSLPAKEVCALTRWNEEDSARSSVENETSFEFVNKDARDGLPLSRFVAGS